MPWTLSTLCSAVCNCANQIALFELTLDLSLGTYPGSNMATYLDHGSALSLA